MAGGSKWKITDPASPYFTPSSDVPGVNICGVELKGERNYRELAIAMMTAFRAKGKDGFLTGLITEPKTSGDDRDDWVRVNSMMVSWMMSSLDPTVKSSIGYTANVKDLWTEIKDRFPRLIQFAYVI